MITLLICLFRASCDQPEVAGSPFTRNKGFAIAG
jgi:hypothetical protein